MHVRAPEPDDAPAVLELIVARDIADLGRPDYTLDDVKGDWASPEIELALDAWLVEDGDGPAGYALLDDSAAALVAVRWPASWQAGKMTTESWDPAGLTVGVLSVQAEHASATRLYESVGMRTVWTTERWDKDILAP